MDEVVFLVDRNSFPVKCPELYDLLSLFDSEIHIVEEETDNPTVFFNKAMDMTKEYSLVVPITRNFYMRDKLKQEGVSLIVSI